MSECMSRYVVVHLKLTCHDLMLSGHGWTTSWVLSHLISHCLHRLSLGPRQTPLDITRSARHRFFVLISYLLVWNQRAAKYLPNSFILNPSNYYPIIVVTISSDLYNTFNLSYHWRINIFNPLYLYFSLLLKVWFHRIWQLHLIQYYLKLYTIFNH